MTDTKTVDRQAVIKEAVEKGYNENEIQRQPTYAIMNMLSQRKKPEPKKEKTTLTAMVKTAHRELKQETEDDFDDTKTVVDMAHITTATNPADQKYKRFTFLVAAKNDLINSVKTNSGLLQQNLEHFDEDDVLTIKKEIADTQHQLNLVNTEMREINTWFQEMAIQKQQFYEQFMKKSSDMSGNMKSHFQRKLQNIEKYMKSLNEQTKAI